MDALLYGYIESNQIEMVKCLYQKNPSLLETSREDNQTPLCVAARLERLEILEWLHQQNPSLVHQEIGNLRNFYENLPYGQKKLESWEKILAVWLKILGEESNPLTQCIYFNIGHMYFMDGNEEKGIESYTKALSSQFKGLGAACYQVIGEICYEHRKYSTALTYFNKTLELSSGPKTGEIHRLIALTNERI